MKILQYISWQKIKMKIKANLITNILVFVTSTLISVFLTPFLLQHIGKEAFGVVRLALLVPTYVGFLTLVISGAVSRYLTIALKNDDEIESLRVFNTALFSIIIVSMIIVLLTLFFVKNINMFFDIPSYNHENVSWLFLTIALSSLLQIISAMFLIPAFANNRLDIRNYNRLTEVFATTVLIVVLVLFSDFPINSIGIAHIIGALLALLISIKVWKRFAPQLTVSTKHFSKSTLKKFTGMGSWLIVDQLGTILLLSIDLIIVNHIFGIAINAEYAIAQQWQNMFRTLATVITGAAVPIIMIKYAQNDHDGIVELSYKAVRYIGMSLAVIGGILAGFSESLLNVWVGAEYVHLSLLMQIMILPMIIGLSIHILFPIQIAYNKIKTPAIVTLLFGLLNAILAYSLAKYSALGFYGVAIASAITLFIRNLVFTVLYSSKITQADIRNYYIEVIKVALITCMVFVFSKWLNDSLIIDSWLDLFGVTVFSTLVSVIFIYVFFTNADEKKLLAAKYITIKSKYA